MTIHTAQLNSVQQVSCLHDADKRTFGFSGQSVQLPTDLGSLVTQEVREVRKFVCSQVKIAPVAVILLQTISVMSYFNYLVVGAGRYEHIMTALRDVLHWLPVPQRIQFKIAISAFDCVREHCPAYFNNVCIPVAGICGQGSAERHDMLVPTTRTQLGRRSFHIAAPAVRNALPSQLHSSSISCGQFRAELG